MYVRLFILRVVVLTVRVDVYYAMEVVRIVTVVVIIVMAVTVVVSVQTMSVAEIVTHVRPVMELNKTVPLRAGVICRVAARVVAMTLVSEVVMVAKVTVILLRRVLVHSVLLVVMGAMVVV
jgi:hypothetical protein